MSRACPACGSEDLRIRKENGGAYGMNNLPLGKGVKGSVALDSTVCVSCGHVDLSISNADALAKIAAKWERP